MAVFKSLTFDGINSLNYGIYVTGEAVYNAPERAVEMVTIPGRNGALAIDQGYFENIEVSYPCGCFAETQADFAEKVSAFRNAIGSRYSYKRLTDEYNTDEYRLGLYKSGLEVSAVRYGTAGQFTITFDCKPQRFLLDGDAELSPTDYSDVHTVSGDIVQIENDGSLGVKSVLTTIEPIQSLNGYDKPWVGGAGKNKLPVTVDNIKAENSGYTWSGNATTKNGVTFTLQTDDGDNVTGILVNGTASADANLFVSSAIDSSITESCTLTGCPSGGSSTTYYQTIGYFGYDYGSGKTATIGAQSNRKAVIMVKSGTTVSNLLFKPMIRLATVTDDTYEPYSNICPISGHTECVTSVSGVNVWDEEWEVGSITYANGTNYNSNQYFRSTNYIPIVPSATYYLHSPKLDLYFYDKDKVYLGRYDGGLLTNQTNVAFTAPSNAHFMRLGSAVSGDNVYNNDISINYPSTDHEYHAYEGHQYTTNLGRTVYGGTLDVVSGVLTVDRAMVDLGTLTWVKYGDYTDYDRYYSSGIDSTAKINSPSVCSHWNGSTTWGAGNIVVGSGGGKLSIFTPKGAYASASELKTAMNGAQLCYELATPQTYQLTPQTIELLLGTNNLWTDCGESTVEYGIPPYYNPTEFDAKPLIKVTGRGTLGIGEYILTITGTVTQTLYIDCETMEIYTLEGTVPTGASSLVSINKTDFPVLKPGHNGVSVGTGLSALTITPRWWRI